MLFLKMLRDLKKNLGQFVSILLLCALAMSMFTIFKSTDLGAYKAMDSYFKTTNVAKGWIYGENFSSRELEKIKNLDNVQDAQLRTMLKCESIGQGNAQVNLYLEEENICSKPYTLEGADFNPKDTDSVWLSDFFAKEWNLKVGDSFSFSFGSVKIEKKIAGLITSPEDIFVKADKDLDTNHKNIAIAYMAKSALYDADLIPYTTIAFTTDITDIQSMEPQISNALDGNYAMFLDKESILGIRAFEDEINQHEQFAYIFTGFFLIVSLLIIMTTMRRIVDSQRTQIGTLNALGISNGKIILHYMSYSIFVSLIGCLLGLAIGPYAGGIPFLDLFAKWYALPGWNIVIAPEFYACMAIIVGSCALSAFFSCRRLLKVEPAQALRPAPPKSGKKTIFEHLPHWDRLSFHTQYNLRDLSRSKLRALMSIVGVLFGTMLMVGSLACFTTVDKTVDWNFDKLIAYQYQVQFADDITPKRAGEYAADYDGELLMTSAIELSAKSGAVAKERESASLVATEGKHLYRLTDTHLEVADLKRVTVALTMKLANKLGLKIGDTVYWHFSDKNDWYASTVGLINRNPTVTGITILRPDLEALDVTFAPKQMVTQKKLSALDTEEIVSVHSRGDMLDSFHESWDAIYLLIGFLVAFAIFFVLIVMYNANNLSFNERMREFATLRVLGLSDSAIRRLLTIQNIWLTIIGVIFGLPLGKVLMQYMMDSNGDQYDYQIFISIRDYGISIALVLFTSVFVSFLFAGKIHKLIW